MDKVTCAVRSISDAPGDGDRAHTYTVSQAAQLLGVSRATVWRWVQSGKLPVSRLGKRTTHIHLRDLERFLPPGISVGTTSGVPHQPIGEAYVEDHAVALRSGREQGPASEHFVQFYESNAYLLNAVGEYIGAALAGGDAAVVVATEDHRLGIESYLRAANVDIAAARDQGRYLALDAAETLGTFMVDGSPDPARFAEVIGGIVARAGVVADRVRVFGEMVALLALDGNLSAVLQLEKLWNRLQERYTFSLFCAYPMDRLNGEALGQLLKDVCDDHCHVIPEESYTTLTNSDDQLRAITMLQQKATWLQAEVRERERAEARLRAALAAEHAAREEAEAALHARDEFLSAAAHELKTPITSLSGFAQLAIRNLKNGGTPDQIARAWASSRQSRIPSPVCSRSYWIYRNWRAVL